MLPTPTPRGQPSGFRSVVATCFQFLGWIAVLAPNGSARQAALPRDRIADARRAVLAPESPLPSSGAPAPGWWSADRGESLEWLRRVPPLADAGAEADRFDPSRLGQSDVDDRLQLERAAAAPVELARSALRALQTEIAAGRIAAPAAVAATALLGRIGELRDAETLFAATFAVERERALHARSAFDRLIAEALREGPVGAAAVAALQSRLALAHPELPNLWLDVAGAAALAGDSSAAVAALERQRGAGADAPARDTATRLRQGTARIAGWWLRPSLDAALPLAPLALPAILPHEDELHALVLRSEMVAALLGAAHDKPDPLRLAAAFDAAPVDGTRCIANEAWFGAFGPLFGRELLGRAGRSDAWIAGARGIVAAIEASHPRHGHGTLERRASDESVEQERPAAWCFLGLAEALLNDVGDVAGARAVLAPRREALAATSSWANQELASETALLLARVELDSGDGSAALSAAEDALRIARELHAGAARERAERQAAGEAPPPWFGQFLGRDDGSYADLLARALATRSSVRATLMGDRQGAAEDLFEAGAWWPWDANRWLRCATDFARRGRLADARACLARVAPRPQHAYDLACCHALLGESDAALDRLDEHLRWAARTPAARAREIDYAARDLDLAALRGHPRFPRR